MSGHRLTTTTLGALLGLLILGAAGYAYEPHVFSRVSQGALVPRGFEGTDYYIYVPGAAHNDQPMTALVALRGVGDDAEHFAASLVPAAEENGWVLVVPHFIYGDWKKVETLKSEEETTLSWLDSLLGLLPDETSLQLRPRVLLYGFSRGAQAAHRFAFMYPRRVLAVASMSAGSYTLPTDRSPTLTPLEFPMGVGDLSRYCGQRFNLEALRQVAFWVGVGEMDDSPDDVPRSFDQYIGSNRVERARNFAKALQDHGVSVELTIVPRLGHQESEASRRAALTFLRALDIERNQQSTDAVKPQPSPTEKPPQQAE